MTSLHSDHYIAGPTGKSVVAAIDDVADALIRLQVIVTACDMAEATSIPEETESARHFIEHPLRMALTVYLGAPVAEQVVVGLLRRLAPTSAQTFGEDPQTAEFRRSLPTRQNKLPVIIVSTPDRGSLQRLAMRLLGRARVTSLGNAERIGELVRRHGPDHTILVLDGCLPSFDLSSIVRELKRFSSAPTIVLWGGGADLRRALRKALGPARIAQAPFDATDRDVGDLIGSLLG